MIFPNICLHLQECHVLHGGRGYKVAVSPNVHRLHTPKYMLYQSKQPK